MNSSGWGLIDTLLYLFFYFFDLKIIHRKMLVKRNEKNQQEQ